MKVVTAMSFESSVRVKQVTKANFEHWREEGIQADSLVITRYGPLTKKGLPDMRFKVNQQQMKELEALGRL